MNIHEHQAKDLLKEFGAPVPKGIVINNINEIKRFWKKNKEANPKTNKIVMQKRINNWKKTIKNLISLNN